MNVVLIGYRGTGKSAVAAILSRRLGLPVVAMDEAIVRRAGQSIPQIVAQHGWPRFRDLESEVAREAGGRDGLIVDTGGGVVERPANVVVLRRNGRVFWLTAPVETIVARIGSSADRPALTPGRTFTDEVAEVLARRTALYAAAADVTVDTAGHTPDEVADAILRALPDLHQKHEQ
jgi:shikimate kinase